MNVREWLASRTDVHEADEGEVLICCPFHGEENPSLSVNLEKGVFHCFACKESGPFPKLIAEMDGISYEQARDLIRSGEGDDALLKSMIDSLLEEDVPIDEKPFSIKSFHKFFPPINEAGLRYLENRNISRKTASVFDLRWGESGVMRDRVVFPVYDSRGKLLTYGGRAISPNLKPKTRKARSGLSSLYGLYELFTEYESEFSGKVFPYLMIVEGEFDAMYLQQLGYFAVSTMGTAKLTGEQKALLKRHAEMVVWSYDGDDAGRRAQIRGLRDTRGFMPTVTVNLPDGTDPNELTEKELKKIYRSVV